MTVDGPGPRCVHRSHDAGIGRALSRDMYANGEWDVFAHLSAIVPHGGTIGYVARVSCLFYASLPSEMASAEGPGH